MGSHYWKFLFPAFVSHPCGHVNVKFIGSFGLAIAYLCCKWVTAKGHADASVTIMTAVPPAMAGTAGALFQLATQVSSYEF